MTVFVDTDVVISSFISNKGAAYWLLNNPLEIKLVISDQSQLEITRVAEELKIKSRDLKLNLINLTFDPKKYTQYVTDQYDSPIVAAAHQAKAKFLLTYNLKHYLSDKIKKLGIIVLTPGQFLQYLRTK